MSQDTSPVDDTAPDTTAVPGTVADDSEREALHPSTAPLAIHDMTVAYHRRPVLWDIDYDASPGQLTAIVGPNGSGKTTLIKAAVDLVADYRENPSKTEIDRFQALLIQRMVETYDRVSPGNLEHVLSELARLFRESREPAMFSRRVG